MDTLHISIPSIKVEIHPLSPRLKVRRNEEHLNKFQTLVECKKCKQKRRTVKCYRSLEYVIGKKKLCAQNISSEITMQKREICANDDMITLHFSFSSIRSEFVLMWKLRSAKFHREWVAKTKSQTNRKH